MCSIKHFGLVVHGVSLLTRIAPHSFFSNNREAEARFAAQRQAELAEGTTWSRVTKLIDLQNSQSKAITRTGPGSTDLTRMKEVLLSLRREGETAPGAQGY